MQEVSNAQSSSPQKDSPAVDLPGEEWRPVPGYDALYEVSSLGRVRSLERTVALSKGGRRPVPARILRPVRTGRGYCSVVLSKGGFCSTFGVHVLVAMAFVGTRPGRGCVVHHKDGVADNNRADNLEWCTLSECVAREDVQKRRVASRRENGPWNNRAKPVEIVAGDGQVVARFLNAKQASKLGVVCAETIRAQCKGRRSRTPGWQWRYAEEE